MPQSRSGSNGSIPVPAFPRSASAERGPGGEERTGRRSLAWLVLIAACGGPGEPPASVATSLALVSGNDQEGAQSAELANAIVVQVNDQDGAGMPGVTVEFTALQGTALTAAAATGADGRVSTRWRLGSTTGEQQLRVEVPGSSIAPLTVVAQSRDVTGPDVVPDALPIATNQVALQVTGRIDPPEANATVALAGGQSAVAGTTDAQGRFDLAVTLNENQVNTLVLRATDLAGNPGPTVQRTVRHDNVRPATPVVDPVPEFTNLNPYTLSGTGEAGTTITVTGGAQTATYGDFIQIFLPQVPLNPNVLNTLTVTATDSAGNVSPAVTVTLTHDGIAPALTIVSPTAASFDTDDDLRVNVRADYSDNGSGIDAATFSATNSRAIGGGAAAGGANALQELRPQFTTVSTTMAETNFAKEFEFLALANTLTLRIADRAGNVRTASVTFTVAGTEPVIEFVQPANGTVLGANAGFPFEVAYRDTAGFLNLGTLLIWSSRGLGGVQMPGTRRLSRAFLPADTANLAPLFAVSAGGAAWTVPDSVSLSGGTHTVVAFVRDRAGNIGTTSVNITAPTPPAAVFLPDTTVNGIGTEFDVTLSAGLVTNLLGVDGRVTYDPAILEVVQVVTTTFTGTTASAFNAGSAGAVRFALATANPLSGGGGLVRIRFRTRALGTSAMQIADLSMNEGGLVRTLLHGQVQVQ